MFDGVLSACLQVANDRVDRKLKEDKVMSEIQYLALMLYKDCLEDLGVIDKSED